MSKVRTYVILPNPFGVEPGVYEAVYDESLRRTFRRAPHLCKRVESARLEASKLRRRTLEKAAALQYRCWYCARLMNPVTIGAPDSIEIEHQIPRSSSHSAAERLENTVAACRQCNNGAYPGKGERTIAEYRALLEDHHGARRVVFYGEVLRWLRQHSYALNLAFPLSFSDAKCVLSWYSRSSGLKLHTWEFNATDYIHALCISIPSDDLLYPLGVPVEYWGNVANLPLGISA